MMEPTKALMFFWVLEWSRERGWSRISNGLVEVGIPNVEDVYDPVVFLKYFKGHLIAAYGPLVLVSGVEMARLFIHLTNIEKQ